MAERIMAGAHTPAQKMQHTFCAEAMTEKEQMTMLIDNYTNLQRIKSAVDKEKRNRLSDQSYKGEVGSTWRYD